MQQGNIRKVSRCQIWQAFVQETVQQVSKGSQVDEDLTGQAFAALGKDGIIQSADQHSCAECTHKYKKTADRITEDDPAAIIGVDEN